MIKKLLKDKRVIFAVLGIVLVLLLVNFNQRMTLLTRLRRQEKELTEYYSHLESTRTALEAELIYAQSDQAVERWAREDAMMIQPGDIPIVLLPPAEQVPTPSVIEPVVIDKIQKWEIWQALFLGD
ncbi:MAG TPA: septum formation initiator family protein [Brevefilum fermentans]|nr:septum formation initiator family protein [Chloroflexota bacterium]HPX95355.1 septum formation initiator family protein [Brevefilum fermentans]HQA29730.1 septum formation initiator family protein [Brevefilum fermentans]